MYKCMELKYSDIYINKTFLEMYVYLNSSVGWFKRASQECCAETKKSGPDTRRLSKKGEAMK